MTSNSTISYSPYITGSDSNIATSTLTINSSPDTWAISTWNDTLYPYEKPKYKCAYCDTVHENNTGICDRCGAPLGAAVRL